MASSTLSSSLRDSQAFQWHYTELEDRNFQIRGRNIFFIVVLFSVVILVALLYFYARWVCRFYEAEATATSHAPQGPPLRTQHDGLDPAAIRGLPVVLHHSAGPGDAPAPVEETECSICLTIFEEGDKVKVLPPCRHFYHSQCVDRWLSSESSCPLCRASLRVSSAV